MNSPKVRFVERAGTTVIEDLGRNNPWAGEWFCPRNDCLPCKGRQILAAEAEQEALQLTSKEGNCTQRNREDSISLPSCTKEGANYSLECLTCRREGRRRVYLGETSRSTYQRGLEHWKEVREGVTTHPLVVHATEEHEGILQEVLFRTLSYHMTPMDRQIQESVNILQEMEKEG